MFRRLRVLGVFQTGSATIIARCWCRRSLVLVIGTLTDGFLKLQSHYLFREHFCRVRRANEKGVVEGVVKFARLNFFVPVPQVRDLNELNSKLAEMCREDLKRRLRGKTGTKAEMLKEDQSAFLPLPVVPFDACRKQPTRANSLSLVRFDDNDYSVPVYYAHHEILVKGFVDRVVLCHKDTVVAEHVRSWGKEGVFFDYRHYLPLLERKPGSLDHARPLMDLNLPECFDTLRRRLREVEEKEGEGLREFIRVLRLLEDYSMESSERRSRRLSLSTLTAGMLSCSFWSLTSRGETRPSCSMAASTSV